MIRIPTPDEADLNSSNNQTVQYALTIIMRTVESNYRRGTVLSVKMPPNTVDLFEDQRLIERAVAPYWHLEFDFPPKDGRLYQIGDEATVVLQAADEWENENFGS